MAFQLPPAMLGAVLLGLLLWPAQAQTCPGPVKIAGLGQTQLTNAGSNVPGQDAGKTEIEDLSAVVAHMDARIYFSDKCMDGSYSNERYQGLKLLGRTLKFTTDISGAGCGCNAALYMVSMKQNSDISSCKDYYCDANSVCGVSCAEVDIMEANKRAWHSTLHGATDHSGMGKGYGGGKGWNGPRDFNMNQYGPGASCIDTSKPFDVAVSFPVNDQKQLQAMTVTLSQTGKTCPLTMTLDSYAQMGEIHAAVEKGMTVVISYWKSDDMLWMDGKGSDNMGPCAADADRCGESVKFYNFKLEAMPGQPPLPAENPAPVTPVITDGVTDVAPVVPVVPTLPTWPAVPTGATPLTTPGPIAPVIEPLPALPPPPATPVQPVAASKCSGKDEDCQSTHCCKEPGTQCFLKNQWWAGCRKACAPGIDPKDEPQNQQPWACTPMGPRTPEKEEEPAGHDEVVLRIEAGELPVSAEEGAEAVIIMDGKQVNAEVVSIERGVTSDEPTSGGGSGAAVGWVIAIGVLILILGIAGAFFLRPRVAASGTLGSGGRGIEECRSSPDEDHRWNSVRLMRTPQRTGNKQTPKQAMSLTPSAPFPEGSWLPTSAPRTRVGCFGTAQPY